MNRLSQVSAKWITYAFLFLVLYISMAPLLYIFFASFKSNQEILVHASRLLPIDWTFQNYKDAWVIANFKQYTFNSMYMAFFIVTGTLIVATMAGYVFSRGRFPGKNAIFTVFTATMFLSLGSIMIYPQLQIAKMLGIHTSLWGVIIIDVFGMHVAAIFIVRSFINSIPYEIDEAAIIDGCSFFRTFWNVLIPLLKPVIATIALITFRHAWNEFLLPMVFTLSNPSQRPLSVGIVALKNTGEAATNWNLMLAGTMMSVIPMLIVYLFLNRYFISGLTSGAIKG
jgi:ABC-type glycerol-3-phosphate transport system permease component